ncbi:hypothetical protein HD806DRAFT_529705 [Xylariaceae sp. AK1471]|nr:hypothetical protein HD806DRAFT_529705 [Xylariaceae sp. AK1471]
MSSNDYYNQGHQGPPQGYQQQGYGGYPQQPPQAYGGPPQGQHYGPPQGQQPMQYQQQPPPQKSSGGGGCLKGCLAALCCCFVSVTQKDKANFGARGAAAQWGHGWTSRPLRLLVVVDIEVT